MPKSNLGKWSLGLIIAMPLLLLIGSSFTNTLYESVPSGETILADIGNRPALAITMLIGFTAGISAFIVGLTAIINRKERNILVYAASVLGAAMILFLIAEFLFPH